MLEVGNFEVYNMAMSLFKKAYVDATDYSKLSISEIAKVILNDWKEIILPKNAYPLELVNAMATLKVLKDYYYLDDGYEIVGRFVNNCKGWNTYSAKIIKSELKKRLINRND